MPVNWRRGFDPEVVIKKLDKIRTLEGDKASFGGFEYHEYITVLKSMVKIDDDISSEVGNSLVVQGFHNAAKKKALTSKSTLSAIRRSVADYHAQPNEPYCLLTSLNISTATNLPGYSINGCTLRFYKRLPKKYQESRREGIRNVASWLIDRDESFSYYVTAHTTAKNEHEAVTRMLDSIDLLRGIWNLHINKSMVVSFGGRKKPVNQITLGALHTLHTEDGSLVENSFWYEPEHYKDHTKVDFSKNKHRTLEFTKNVRAKLKSSNYGKKAEIAIIRYVRSLDSQDYNASFVKLWSVLEYLTDTLRDSYDKTIKRTTFMYSDREYAKQVLEHLRQYRNKSVHSGSAEHDIDMHLYQLKGYVEQLLRFHIANHFKFGSLAEAAKLMDLKPDVAELTKQIGLLKSGIQFMGG